MGTLSHNIRGDYFMFQTILFTMLGAIVGTAGSIVLMYFVGNLPSEIQLATAAFLGAVCSSMFICREKSIQKKLGKDHGIKKKGHLSKLWAILFWLIFIGGLAAAIVIIGLKIYNLL
jgi:hypothetical protein